MMEMLEFFTAKLGSFFSWLTTLILVEGVSLLGFFAAMFLICLLVHNLLLRAK